VIAEKRMLEKVSYFEIILVNEKEQTLLEICKIMINIKNWYFLKQYVVFINGKYLLLRKN